MEAQTPSRTSLAAPTVSIPQLILTILTSSAQSSPHPHDPHLVLDILTSSSPHRVTGQQGVTNLHNANGMWVHNFGQNIDLQVEVMWALTDFTAENGATWGVLGSHRMDPPWFDFFFALSVGSNWPSFPRIRFDAFSLLDQPRIF